MATAKPPFRDRFGKFIGKLREQEHRQMAWNFTKSILLLAIAMIAALYANSVARGGRVIPSAIAAFIALSIAVWVAFPFCSTNGRRRRLGLAAVLHRVPAHAGRLDLHRGHDRGHVGSHQYQQQLALHGAVGPAGGDAALGVSLGLEFPVPPCRGGAPGSLLRQTGVPSGPVGKESQAGLPDFLTPGEPGR